MTRSLMDKARGRNKPQTGSTDTLIDAATTLTGQVTFQGTLVVDGVIDGGIQSAGSVKDTDDTLVINETGKVNADKLIIKHVIVKGTLVATDIKCSTLEIAATGKVSCLPAGKILYKTLTVAPGAVLAGYAHVDESSSIADSPNQQVETPL